MPQCQEEELVPPVRAFGDPDLTPDRFVIVIPSAEGVRARETGDPGKHPAGCAAWMAFGQSADASPRFEAANVRMSAKVQNPSVPTGPVRQDFKANNGEQVVAVPAGAGTISSPGRLPRDRRDPAWIAKHWCPCYALRWVERLKTTCTARCRPIRWLRCTKRRGAGTHGCGAEGYLRALGARRRGSAGVPSPPPAPRPSPTKWPPSSLK